MKTRNRFSIINRRNAGPRLFLPRVLAFVLGMVLLVPASQAAQHTLQSLDYTTLPGNKVALTLSFSEEAPDPMVFSVHNPASISIDLPNTNSTIENRLHMVDVGSVRSAVVAEGKGRTRLVINMTQLNGYDVRTQGNTIRINVGSATSVVRQGAATSPGQNAKASSAQDSSQALLNGSPRVEKVNFHRGAKGSGRVIVHLTQESVPVNIERRGSNIVATFPNVHIPEKLRQQLLVTDFATPVKLITVKQVANDARVVVTPRPDTDFQRVAYQMGDRFTLELQPTGQATKGQNAVGGGNANQPNFTGQRISLNFQQVGLRSLLQIIAEVANKDIVVSSQVQGAMSLRLNKVPWDQALHIILTSNGLGMRKNGDVIMVAPLGTLQSVSKARAAAQKAQKSLRPLQTAVIQINYAKADQIASLIQSKGASVLSDRGAVTVSQRTNSLLVMDTAKNIRAVRQLVNKLDRPVRQVSISTRIVVATQNFSRKLGTQFGISAVAKPGSGLISTSGTAAGSSNIVNSMAGGGSFPSSLPSLSNQFNVNSAIANPAGTIALSILNSNFLINLELSALQAEGKTKVISTPRVITTNGSQAIIKSGVEIPYQEATSSGATNIQFKEAVLSLKVTPRITPDGRIIMDLEVHDDNPRRTGGGEPSINTRSIKTTVMVANGETVVLGGIYKKTTSTTVSKVPLLGDIPIIGFLFRQTAKINEKKQLLVFVTPKIIDKKLEVDDI